MPSAYFLLVLREYGTSRAAEKALLEGTGFASATEVGAEITLGQQLRQVANLDRRGPAGWSLDIGVRFGAVAHGPLGFATVSAPTLGDSLAVIARYGHVRAPHFRAISKRDGDTVVIRMEERVLLSGTVRTSLFEMLMQSLQALVESVLGGPTDEAAFGFAWTPPAYASEYRRRFHGTVRFDAPATTLTIPARWLALPCPLADPATYAESLRKLEALDRRLEGDDYIVARLEQLIGASSTGGPSLAEAAKRMGASARTLLRRLRRAGTTYHELVDGHRRARAEALLANGDYGIAEVSAQVGYEDPANFGRACRRWFGMAPGLYRKHLLGRAS
jgi:AraC-like DNA-binding protein